MAQACKFTKLDDLFIAIARTARTQGTTRSHIKTSIMLVNLPGPQLDHSGGTCTGDIWHQLGTIADTGCLLRLHLIGGKDTS